MRIIRSSSLQKVNADSHWVHIVSSTATKTTIWNQICSRIFPRNNGEANQWSARCHSLSWRYISKWQRRNRTLKQPQWFIHTPQRQRVCCRREKCTFAESSVEYLGHTLSKEGISQGKKVDAVYNMPPPTDVSSVKSFLGSVQFYRKFIPNLATLAEPLYLLTRKGYSWKWTSEEQGAFQKTFSYQIKF